MDGENAPTDLEGYVDDLRPDWIRGWCWAPQAPEDTVAIEVVDQDGRVVGRTTAKLHRGDLEAAGKRGGRCGFELDLLDIGAGPFLLRARSTLHAEKVRVLIPSFEGAVFRTLDPMLRRLAGPSGVAGWLDRADAEGVSGWCHSAQPFTPPPTLDLVADGQVVAQVHAAAWRNDLEDFRQGDGRCGFRFDLPDALYDGADHRLSLRLAGGEPLMTRPITVSFPAQPPARVEATPDTAPASPPGPPIFSVIVNFYNMKREAARTLLSLSRTFQRGVEALPYEVLCVDNGSTPPLEASFIESFGPEFRLVRPSALEASPCRAMNEAAAQAKGRWLAVMIDGAHLLSPGVLREAHDVFAAHPGAIVALRQWFVGGDQRWFSVSGYRRDQEDVLFSRIDWPNDGYRIFDISSPMYESPNSWLDGLSESNCLFVPAEVYRRIGGFDVAFDIPGAGFANLDLFRRAATAADAVFALVGEASFHQYHGGVTTNADDEKKDGLVRAYASTYERLRGSPFVNVAPHDIRLSGAVRTGSALTARQRPFCPAKLGVTTKVRPRLASIQFDEEAQQYLQSAYVETGRHLETRWRGLQVGVAPSDLIDLQEALWRVRPERLVLRAVAPGLVAFLAAILPGLGLSHTQVLWVTAQPQDAIDGVEPVVGDPQAPSVLGRLDDAIGDAEHVLVVFQPDADDALPLQALGRYGGFVTAGSYLVVLNVALGQPWLGYSTSYLHRAIVRFTQSAPNFVIDHTLNRHFVTTCPTGFLRRSLDPSPISRYDPALDDIGGL